MRKKLVPALIGILALVFVLIPLPKAGIYLRFYTTDLTQTDFKLYYSISSDSGISEEKTIPAQVSEDGIIAFYIPGDVANELEALRMDFPEYVENAYIFTDVSVSSAGIVRKRFHPCTFWAEENLQLQNGIAEIGYAYYLLQAQVKTVGDDPFVFFQGNLLLQIVKCASRYRLTRLCIVGLIALGVWLYRKNIFQTKEGEF